ncbi:MAG: hypothetical protein K0M39_12710 [Rhizobium sp.]|nr:hypothetical protein [Rhizobium sp.]
MRISSITARDVHGTLRFDSKFHLSRQNPFLEVLRSNKWPMQSIGDAFGKENIWTGNIFSRVYAPSPEHGKPLLVPYDLFRYVPWSDKTLSRSQVSQFERLEMKRGWLFIVCSGRNLGPVTIADTFCEQFTMSHDMVRIAVEPSDELFYLAAFLSTAHGQATIRTDMNGSVIDHTDANKIAALRYPMVDEDLRSFCATNFRKGFEKRERARLLLAETKEMFLRLFGLENAEDEFRPEEKARRFTLNRSHITDRFDAEPQAPRYSTWRERILASGGCRLSEIADVQRPANRYKTSYVEDERYGVKMMGGRHVSQYRPIALRLMSLTAFKNPSAFRLNTGMTLLTADGRAEENLADCALVTNDRQGWAASGHVHRVVPKPGVHPGLVYLACATGPVQAQLKSLATGSVVDALSESDVSSVIVPYGSSSAAIEIGKAAQTAWELFAAATSAEDEAISALEAVL